MPGALKGHRTEKIPEESYLAADWPIPHQRQGGRRATARARKARDILYQTASRLPVANRVFLGSWMVDICQEGRSQRLAPQRRHTAHLRLCSHCAPRKPSSWDGGGDKPYRPNWREHAPQVPGRLKGSYNTQAQLSLRLCGVPESWTWTA